MHVYSLFSTAQDNTYLVCSTIHYMTEGSEPGRKPRVSDEEILALFRESTDPVLSTAEVTEQLPIKRSATYKRLTALREEGRLAGKQIGGRNSVWWIPDGNVAD